MRPFLAAIALVAVACIPTLGDDAADVAAPTPVSDARAGGTIRVEVPALDTVDPGDAADPAARLVVRTACEQLISFDPATGEPRPALAESWTIAAGGRKLFVRLRDDARFSDGSPVTARDVTFTLSRVASQAFASRAANLVQPVAGYEEIHGDVETRSARMREELAGARAADTRTVEIELKEPRADFFLVLGHPALTPVSQRVVEADPDAFARRPICAGPYRFAAPFERDEAVRLVRNDGYEGINTAYTRGGAGWADEIVFGSTGPFDVARARTGSVTAPGARIEFVGLPTSIPPFDDPAVRRALSLALDRDRIAEVRGSSEPATGFLAQDCDAVRTDVGAARALIADAGLDRTTFAFNDEFGNGAVVREVARQWRRALGLRVELEPMRWEEFLGAGRSTAGFDAPFRWSWEPAVPSPEHALVPLFDDSGIGADNVSRFDSLTFADALDEARRTVEDDERAEKWRAVEQVLCDQMPMIPLTVDERAFRLGDRVASATGRVLSVPSAEPILRELYIVHFD